MNTTNNNFAATESALFELLSGLNISATRSKSAFKTLPFEALELNAKEANFDPASKEGQIFMAAQWVAVDQLLPLEKGSPVGANLREYGRAAVAGYREGNIKAYFDFIRTSITDKLLPANAIDACLHNESVGLMAYKFCNRG